MGFPITHRSTTSTKTLFSNFVLDWHGHSFRRNNRRHRYKVKSSNLDDAPSRTLFAGVSGSQGKIPKLYGFCFHPEAATEVTLQPITRFGFDAAIIFSDILVIPQALGQEVWFVKGEGPKLGALPDIEVMESRLESGAFLNHLTKVYEAIALTRRELPAETDLFGFAGAPWTLLTYMIEQGSSNDYAKALALAAAEPELFQRLLSVVEQAVGQHLKAQVQAGANLLQLFDSWAGGIPDTHQQTSWSFDPLVRIASTVSQDAPVVLFAKGLAQRICVGQTG